MKKLIVRKIWSLAAHRQILFGIFGFGIHGGNKQNELIVYVYFVQVIWTTKFSRYFSIQCQIEYAQSDTRESRHKADPIL